MKWLTIDYIKQHSRLDFDDEISVIELYACSAEETILRHLNRSYQDLIEEYGDVPADVRLASLLLVNAAYEQRSPMAAQSMSVIPYGNIDMKLRPYMRLTTSEEQYMTQKVVIGSQAKILIQAALPDELTLQEVDFTVTVGNLDQKDKTISYDKSDCILTDEGNYVVLLDTKELGIGSVMVTLAVQIPDKDFPNGYRREIVRINPHLKITG